MKFCPLLVLYYCAPGKPCDISSSTCNGKNEQCHGRGPGWPDEYLSNKIIAQRQFSLAKTLQNRDAMELKGPVGYVHTYLNMSSLTVKASKYGPAGRTCPPAMGYSFAAGTTDGEYLGKRLNLASRLYCESMLVVYKAMITMHHTFPGPGDFDFTQGQRKGSPFWRFVSSFIKSPSHTQNECHSPKPILIDTGEVHQPYPW